MNYFVLSLMCFLLSCGPSKEFLVKEKDLKELQIEFTDLKKDRDSLSTETLLMQERITIYKEFHERFQEIGEQYENILVKFKTSEGEIVLEFFPRIAPLHVLNFIRYAQGGMYTGTIFHRVIENFVIQGGDPNTKTDDIRTHGSGEPLGGVPAEFSTIGHDRGMLSMARSQSIHSGTSQFFILHKPAHQLNGKYTVFGRVVEGMDVVDKIATAPHLKLKDAKKRYPKLNLNAVPQNYPKNPVKILAVEVYTKKENS